MKGITSFFMAIVLMSCFMTGKIPKSERKTSNVNHYHYPINTNSDDWFDYSVLEKSEMLKISQDCLDKMSDLQLLYAIADYPYFGDIYAYGFDKEGLEIFADYCSAFEELLSRASFLSSLNKYGLQIAQEYTSDTSDRLNSLRGDLIKDLLYYYNTPSSGQNRDTTIIIYTPNGSPVQALLRDEPHDGEPYHWQRDNYYETTYAVTKIYSGTCIYNCHSYAWSLHSPSNPYWINSPGPYMSDGSYTQLYSGSILNAIGTYGVGYNDVIYYPGKHSALIIGITTSNTIPLASITAVSKWGFDGVFQHAVGNVPPGFYSSNVSIWHQ